MSLVVTLTGEWAVNVTTRARRGRRCDVDERAPKTSQRGQRSEPVVTFRALYAQNVTSEPPSRPFVTFWACRSPHVDLQARRAAAGGGVAERVVDELHRLRGADARERGEAAVRAGADAGDRPPRTAGLAADRGERRATDRAPARVPQPAPDPDPDAGRHRQRAAAQHAPADRQLEPCLDASPLAGVGAVRPVAAAGERVGGEQRT